MRSADEASEERSGPGSFPDLLRRFMERRPPPPTKEEGLRERKKRQLRQRISDTATVMFLERGFDEVRVSEVAAACEVSEKTVFNYFPTKESLLFDREEDQAQLIAEALRDSGDGTSIVDAMVAVIEGELDWLYGEWSKSGVDPSELSRIRRFAQLIEETSALTAARYGMTERLTAVAATALAERAGVDPEDPEPQIAASLVMGLWSTQFRAMVRYSDGTLSAEDVHAGVLDELHRAAQIADTGLSSFDAAVQGSSGKQQFREAAEAADAARRQVVAAMKQAREAWKQVMSELHEQHHGNEAHFDRREWQQQMKGRQWELREEIRALQQELRRQHAEMRREQMAARQGKAGARRGGRSR
jgi:AcrR family transcriptional regulator